MSYHPDVVSLSNLVHALYAAFECVKLTRGLHTSQHALSTYYVHF